MGGGGAGRAWGLALTLVADACIVLGMSVLVAQHRRFARLQLEEREQSEANDSQESAGGSDGTAAARAPRVDQRGPKWTAATVAFLVASVAASAIPLFTRQQSRYHQVIMVWNQISRSPKARSHSAGNSLGTGMVTVALNAFLSNPVIHSLVHDLIVTALGGVVALRYVLWSPSKPRTDNDASAVQRREYTSFAVATIASLLVLGGGLGWVGMTDAGLDLTAVCRLAAAAFSVGAAAAAALGCHDTSPASQAFLSLQVAGLAARCALWVASSGGSWTMAVERMPAVAATQRVAAAAALVIYAVALLAGMISAPPTTHWSRHVGPAVVAVAAGALAAAPKDLVVEAAAAVAMMSVMAYVIIGAAPGVAAVALTIALLTNCYTPPPFSAEDSLHM